MWARVACVTWVLCASAACTAPQALDHRTWFAIPAGVVDLDQGAGVAVDDGLGAGLDGGFELNHDLLRASWEIGTSWSDHEVTPSVDLQAWRIFTGLRLAARSNAVPLGAYARGGWMWRSENSDDELVYPSNDQWGYYAGAGIEWWYASLASLGPFVTWTRGEEDHLEELWFGIAVRFYVED